MTKSLDIGFNSLGRNRDRHNESKPPESNSNDNVEKVVVPVENLLDAKKDDNQADIIAVKQDDNHDDKIDDMLDVKPTASSSTVEEHMSNILKNKKKRQVKEYLGLRMSTEVCDVLRQFKKDTDIGMSDAIEQFVRVMLPDYFKN